MNRLKMLAAMTAVLFLAVMTSTGAIAQIATGSITGLVTDKSGAILTDADITVTRPDTGLVLKTKSNNAGIYNVQSLNAGFYQVEVEHAGFTRSKASVTLTVGQTAQVDAALSVGAGGEVINVEGQNGAALNTQESNLSYVVGTRQVADLPMNGRNPYGLAALSPGIFPGTSFGAGLSQTRGAVIAAATNNFQSNGGYGGSNEILLDGFSIIVCCQGQPPVTPSVEVVDQFSVITSVPAAQFGRSSGGILNIVTKQGTNKFHGDVFEYFRNEKLDAANYFTKRSGVFPIPSKADYRLPRKFNQFGGFVSGPIFKDKTFFTFGYEGQQNRNATFTTTTVPTALARQGIFTEAPKEIYDPFTVAGSTRPMIAAACNGATCYPAGRYIPASSISPVAAKLLALIPAPLNTALANNYSFVRGIKDTDNQFNFRIDHNFSPSQRTFVRGTRLKDSHHENDVFNATGGPGGVNQNITGYLFGLGHTWTVSPSLLLQFSYGFGYQQNVQVPQNFGIDPTQYGFSKNFASEQQRIGLPLITFSSMLQLGNAANSNVFTHYTHLLNASAILQHGHQTMTFGYDGRLFFEHQYSVANPLGTIAFDTTLTNGPTVSQAVPTNQAQFDAFAAFLLGAPTTSSLTRQATITWRQPYNGIYFQDDYRIFPTLTLNLGLRYDLELGPTDRFNAWADFDPALPNPLSTVTGLTFTGGAAFVGTNGNSSRLWKSGTKSVAPRVGFSWSPYSNTVVRGGYGILYLPTTQRGYPGGTIGYSQATQFTTANTQTPANTFADPFPTGVALPAGATAGVVAGAGTSVQSFLYNTPIPYQQQWNFGIEQALSNKLIMTLNYAGGHGVHLPLNGRPNDLLPSLFVDPNNATAVANQISYLQANVTNPFQGRVSPGSLNTNATVQRIQLLSAFPQYATNSGLSNGSLTEANQGIGSATFEGLQAGLQFRGSRSGSAAVFYSWSKLLGNVSDLTNGFLNTNGNPAYQDYYFLRQYEKSNLATDIPHRIVANANYSLPFGHGQRFGGNVPGYVNQVIGGWKLNLIAAVQSGFPLNITQSGGAAFSGGRPTYTGAPSAGLAGGNTRDHLNNYLNPAGFRLTRSFELGNVPRNAAALRSPLTFQDDLSAIKEFPIHDEVRLQFRLEAFNFLNKVQWGFPNTVYNTSAFGAITSQGNSPRNVQAALKLMF